MKPLNVIGAAAGAVMAILTLLGFLGEPFLEDYVDAHIKEYDKKKQEEDSGKVKLRNLLSDKMGIDEDEVHIEIGRWYKKEGELDVAKELFNIKQTLNAIRTEFNYYHPQNMVDEIVEETQQNNQ